MNIYIPADVPHKKVSPFKKNYTALSASNTGLFVFAGDQKIEHLNADFYGPRIAQQAQYPEHLFKIAAAMSVGAFATQLGLIARYGHLYPTINYLAKLNSKTNCLSNEHVDPISKQLWSVANVIQFKKESGLSLCGIGYTIYLGSIHESIMLAQAAQAIYQAHQEGLVATVWIYPRGKHIDNNSIALFQGAAGVANALGADIVKLAIPPQATVDDIAVAVQAAGNTRVIVAGGPQLDQQEFIKKINIYRTVGIAGAAVGRNIFQRTYHEAIAFAKAVIETLDNTN